MTIDTARSLACALVHTMSISFIAFWAATWLLHWPGTMRGQVRQVGGCKKLVTILTCSTKPSRVNRLRIMFAIRLSIFRFTESYTDGSRDRSKHITCYSSPGVHRADSGQRCGQSGE